MSRWSPRKYGRRRREKGTLLDDRTWQSGPGRIRTIIPLYRLYDGYKVRLYRPDK